VRCYRGLRHAPGHGTGHAAAIVTVVGSVMLHGQTINRGQGVGLLGLINEPPGSRDLIMLGRMGRVLELASV
jgi:hypothetical protein